ncbi:MAG TPA: copper resistance protein B [Rhizomicrobium sp.]|nr:copper resistance protein B [Rhizomicrobium sp.]
MKRRIAGIAALLLPVALPAWADETQSGFGADAPETFSMVKADLDGTQSHGLGLFNWDAEGWYGGDTNKLWLSTQGLLRGNALDDGETEALWSRNIADYWDFQAGVGEDFAPTGRTYAVFGFEGLAPYFFETQAHAFISDRGDVSARIKQWIDLPVTQHLFVEPHGQVDLAIQNVPDERVGSGVSDIELGLQTRYEVTRKFAPYIDLVWSKAFANTASYDRINNEPPDELTLRAGIRLWF